MGDIDMTKIKPIDWDALSKVWAWDSDEKFALKGVLFLTNQLNEHPFQVLVIEDGEFLFEEFKNISETDPRVKTPKMLVMTAEELNDIYWEYGKDFRFRASPKDNVKISPPSHLDYDIDKECEWSENRGKTWNKCEVVE